MSKTRKRPTLGGGKGLDILFGGNQPPKDDDKLPSSFTKIPGQASSEEQNPENNPPGQDPDKNNNPDDNLVGQDPERKDNDNSSVQHQHENQETNPPDQRREEADNLKNIPPSPVNNSENIRPHSFGNNSSADNELDRKPIFIHLTKSHRRKLDNLVSELRYMTDQTHDNSSVIRGLIDFATHHLDNEDGFFNMLIDKYFDKEARPSKKTKK